VTSIGSLNESSLHAQIKEWYSKEGDRLEEKVDGSVIDIVRGEVLIEIQTGNFASIRNKLTKLLHNHKLHLVYPIPERKWIVRISKKGRELAKRRSPKKGKLLDIFDELIRIPELFNSPNFSFEALLVHVDEHRCDDGKGSWRRKGVSIVDRLLLDVKESFVFSSAADLLSLFPLRLKNPFTNKDLAVALKISIAQARRITYTLRKIGLIELVGKQVRSNLYKLVSS